MYEDVCPVQGQAAGGMEWGHIYCAKYEIHLHLQVPKAQTLTIAGILVQVYVF